jgi:ribonuclease D
VDVEGTLRKGGTIEMIQINNGQNTFLLDFYSMLINNDAKTLYMAKKVLRNVFANENILKVFHDCRHDSLVIHEVISTCIKNIFDTSAV